MKKYLIALLLLIASFVAHAADGTITGMTAAGALGGTELVECVQSGNTRKCTINQIQTYALTGTAATATALAANPADCAANNFATTIAANGDLTCAQPSISAGVSGLGTGVATALGTPSSANLAAALTDETGTGAAVFANTPTLVTPVLGAATGTSLALGGGTALTSTNQTGTGNIVLSASPTLTGTITAAAANFSGNVTAANLAAAGTLTDGKLCTYATSGTAISCTTDKPTGAIVGISDTQTLTNKTFDTQGTGNVFKMLDTIQLTHPHNCDGTGAVISTTATAIDYGRATYSNSADQTANYCEYRITVPFDLDTATEWSARIQFRLGNTDTGTHRYVLSTVTQADSSAAAGTPATAINLDFAGDGSGASGDIESVGFTTLTGWAATMTADRLLVIRLARDGNATEDGSTVDSAVMNLVLKYGRSQ